MVVYSNHSPAENKMVTRAMLIRDTLMLLEELAVEQDKDTCIIDLKLTCGPTM